MKSEMDSAQRILFADDDPDDVELALLQFREAGFQPEFDVVRDGDEAIARLEAALASGARLPGLILIDLRMPRVGGEEVLERARRDPRLQAIPVVIMSDSFNEDERRRCLDGGAAAFIAKPTLQAEFMDVAEMLNGLLTRASGGK